MRAAPLLLVIAVATLAALAVPATGHAQQPQRSAADIAQARELFIQAQTMREAGDVRGALEKFKAADALGQTPITGVELGRTQVLLGMLIEARETFLAVGRLAVSPGETSHSADARKDAARLADTLAKRIPSITITVTGASLDQTTVTIDGGRVPSAALGAPRLLDPGQHTVAAASGTLHVEVSVSLQEADSKPVELRLAGAPTAGPPQPAVTSGAPAADGASSNPADAGAVSEPTRTSVLVWTGAGVGVVGIGVGVATGVMALSEGSTVQNACNGLACPRSIDGNLSTGRTLATVSDIAFALGGAGVATMVVGFFVGGGRRASPAPATGVRITPWLGAGSAGMTGSF
jgi:hypothetical protein